MYLCVNCMHSYSCRIALALPINDTVFSTFLPPSFPPFLLPSLPPFLPSSLPPSLPSSLPHSLLTSFLPSSLPPSLPSSLPPFLTPSSLPHSLTPSLPPLSIASLRIWRFAVVSKGDSWTGGMRLPRSMPCVCEWLQSPSTCSWWTSITP